MCLPATRHRAYLSLIPQNLIWPLQDQCAEWVSMLQQWGLQCCSAACSLVPIILPGAVLFVSVSMPASVLRVGDFPRIQLAYC